MVRQARISGAPAPLAARGGDARRVPAARRLRAAPARAAAAPGAPAAAGAGAQRKIAIFVEPSPFTHVSGMKIRFTNLIKGLRDIGDDVTVVTPCINPPKQFHGAKVVNVLGFNLPFYRSPTLLLSLGLSVRVLWRLLRHRPDVIHVSSPGFLVFSAILYAKLLAIPLVVSYHTHVPHYVPQYTWPGFAEPIWKAIRFSTLMADLTLVPSYTMKRELHANKCRSKRIDVWQQAVDTQLFNPRFRCEAMRARLSGGRPDRVILTYVGRLGAEKNLFVLRDILLDLPDNVCLAFVGDGPVKAELEAHFQGLPVVFTGMLGGDDLSAAYASADIFMMPSESETLGFVALEAMASGLAVVAVAAGGLIDIITRPGVIGHMYQPGDYRSATDLTRELVADPARRRAMADAGRREVEAKGWLSAIQRIRDQQYQRAIRTFRAHKRFRWLAIRIWLARVWLGFWRRLRLLLDYAAPYRRAAPKAA